MKSNEVWIPFDPAPVDVVSTKLRTWNLTHPGNLYYTDLVNNNVDGLDKDDINEFKRRAEQIVHSIIVERGGRFLRPPDLDTHPITCVVLDGKQAVAKVVHALRTAQSRQESTTKRPPKKNGVGRPAKPISTPVTKSSTQSSSRPRSRRSSASDSFMYQATSTNKKIPQHTLNMISSVCNQLNAETAHRILDLPLEGQSLDSEPDRERRMRLQLRHRFAAAAAMGMSPLEFASRLLKLWEGKLVMTKRRPKPKTAKSSLEDGTNAIANSVPSTTVQTTTTISLSPIVPSRLDEGEHQIIITGSTFGQSAASILEPTEAVPLSLESNATPERALHENEHDLSDLTTVQTVPALVPSHESLN